MSQFYKSILCLLLLVGYSTSRICAQNAEEVKTVVKGKVVDKKTKAPISGVSVTELDADGRILKGTSTDIEGNFVLKMTNAKHKISISYIGYTTTEQSLNGRTNINFQMEEANAASMDQVFITAARNTDNGM